MTGSRVTRDSCEEAAGLLLSVRGDRHRIAALPAALRPRTVDEGYDIQDAAARALGAPVAGWKCACTAADQQAFLAVDEPFAGRVFAPVLFDSPAKLSAEAFFMRGLEGEFAFRLGADLPARDAPHDRAAVMAAIASLHPAIEIVDSRFVDWLAVGAASLVADNAVNGALVLGAAVTAWDADDLADHPVRMTIDGVTVGEGVGGLALGHPLDALVWLANRLARRGIGLAAGHVVTTGTCTGIHFVDAGAEAVADFADFGTAVLRFR